MILGLIISLLPIVAYICLFILLFNRNPNDDLRQVALRAGILFATYLIVIEEVLSLFHGITRLGLVIGWLSLILALILYIRRVFFKCGNFRLPRLALPAEWSGRLSLLLTASVLVITIIVAWLTPPQTWDSLTYHLSRVAHWAQNHSVANYITGIERQNSMNPAAEMITLNSYVLVGGDRLATFTQWFAMLGSLLGVSLIAKNLGAKKYGQWLSICFAVTLPMGIVQSSSTITDYATTFWMVCVAVETLNYYQGHKNECLVYLSLSAGLSFLTKATVLPVLAPFGLWVAFLIFRYNKPIGIMRWVFTSIILVVLVNAAYLTRNYETYGALYNPVDTGKHLNELRTIPGAISILVRNIGQQAGFSNLPAWNDWVELNILKVHVKLGVDMQDPRTTNEGVFKVQGPNRGEDTTTNPYHAALILLAIPLSVIFAKRIGWLSFIYATAVIIGFILFSSLYKWNVYGVRYQLTFFILMMPFVGVVLGCIERVKLGLLIAYGLLFTSLPWLLQIPSRPIVTDPKQSSIRSILVEPRANLYFANAAGVGGTTYLGLHQIASAIKDQDCSQVGLMLHGDSPEYLVWTVLEEPNNQIRLEWNVVGTPSEKYTPNDFDPCAYICEGCLESGQKINDLNLFLELGGYELFMNPTQ